MSITYIHAGLAGLGAATRKSGLVPHALEQHTAPIADEFVKTAVIKQLTDEEKQAIVKKLSQYKSNGNEELRKLISLQSMVLRRDNFYSFKSLGILFDNLFKGKQFINFADGQRVSIDKVLNILNRREANETIDPATLDEESRRILAHYDEEALADVLSDTKVGLDFQPCQDLQSGKISLEDIGSLFKLKIKHREDKASETIKKYTLQKVQAKHLLEKENRTPEDQKFLEQFEKRAAAMEQSLRAGKPAPDFVISLDEKLKPGFRSASFQDFYTSSERTIYDPEHDPALQVNINEFKAKLAADPLINNPVRDFYKKKRAKEKRAFQILVRHVNDSFPVHTKDAVEIFEKLAPDNHHYLLGSLLAPDGPGIGVCRHKTLLVKALADAMGWKVSMNSGTAGGGAHAWNTAKMEHGQLYLLDAHNHIFKRMHKIPKGLFRQGETVKANKSPT